MDTLSFVIVGHIDHGKSTLIGRLLYDTDSLTLDRVEEMQRASADRGRQTEFAYLLDHLEEERQQGITIDTTQVFFKTSKRRYVIIDAPGHVEFVKNMITGASQAEAAVLIIDVTEGVKQQTRRHSYLLSLLGLNQVIVVLNKMDLVDYSVAHFERVKKDIQDWLKSINIEPLFYIPISAINGDNIAKGAKSMGWYAGPTFLESLDALQERPPACDKPLLLPIQDVYRIDHKRIGVGRVESGVIHKAARVKVLPGGQETVINSIEKFLEDTDSAGPGECIGITTTDSVFLDRGDIICLPDAQPTLTDKIAANIFWMTKKDFTKDQKLVIRCATQETSCKIETINRRINSSTLEVIGQNAEGTLQGGSPEVIKNLEVAEVIIKTKKPIAVKSFNDVQELGRFVLIQDENICAGGTVVV